MLGKFHPHYYLGALIGLVIGYVISKIYQIWAIVYRENHFDLHMQNSWNTKNPPLWISATENPEVFSFWVVFIYIIVGLIFVTILKTKKN
jgi:hypothetical protein